MTSEMGPIRSGEAYSLEEFQRLIGQAKTAIRSFRLQGLRVIRAGNRRYILGRDWIAFLDRLGKRLQGDPEEMGRSPG